jgi:hypothetical protein
VAVTTRGEIRDRIDTVIRELIPALDSMLPFRRFTDELGADFRRYALDNPAGATRLYQVTDLAQSPPLVSNADVVLVEATFEIVVAYAQSHVFGANAARARRDAIEKDEAAILAAVGMHGRANFTPPTYPDACWVSGEEPEREEREGVDFLVIRQVMQFYRAVGG